MNRTRLALFLVLIGAPLPAQAQFGPPVSDSLSLAVGREADGPVSAALTPDGSVLVIAHRDTDNVTFFDTALGRAVATVDVGARPAHVSLAPNGATGVVCNLESATLSVLDLASPQVLLTVPLQGRPTWAAVTSDGTRAVVSQFGPTPAAVGLVSVIDLSTGATLNTFQTEPHVFGVGFELMPNDVELAVPSYGNELHVYDITSGSLLQTLPVGNTYDGWPTSLRLSADGTRLAATIPFSQGGGALTLTVYDTGTWSRLEYSTGISLGYLDGSSVEIVPGNQLALVTTEDDTALVDLTTSTSTVFPGGGTSACVSYDGRYALVSGTTRQFLDLTGGVVAGEFTDWSLHTIAVSSSTTYAAYTLGGDQNELVETLDLQAGAKLASAPTGEELELDWPSVLTAVPGSAAVLVGCRQSRNVAVVDVLQGEVAGVAPFAGALLERIVASPVGDTAIVTTRDGPVTVLDPLTGAVIDVFDLPGGVAGAAYSPDGATAYLRGRAPFGQLQPVHVLSLSPAGASVTATILASTARAYDYGSQIDSIEIAPDGATLALVSFSGPGFEIAFIDTTTQTLLGAVNVDSLLDVLFDRPDRLLIGWSGVTEVLLQGGAPTIGAQLTQTQALRMALDADGSRLFIGSGGALTVLDLTNNTQGAAVPAGTGNHALHVTGRHVYVQSSFTFHHFEVSGTTLTSADELATSYSMDMAFSAFAGTGVSLDSVEDRLDLFDFGDLPTTSYCDQPVPNSQGVTAELAAEGVFYAGGGGPLTLRARDVPPGMPGYLLASRTPGLVSNPAGAMGDLCVAGNVARFAQSIRFADAAGTFEVSVDTLAIPLSPRAAIQPGETWHFQAWYRDVNPAPTSAFTNAVSVPFR